jgi:hypothetical protein
MAEISTDDYETAKASGRAPKAKPYVAYNMFRLIAKRRNMKLKPQEMAALWQHEKVNFTKDFESLYFSKNGAVTAGDATRTVEEFLKPDSGQYKTFSKRFNKFRSDSSTAPSDAAEELPGGFSQGEKTATQVESGPEGDKIMTNKMRDLSKTVLRSRTIIAGPELVEETKEQAVSDAVQADLFEYKPKNEDRGEANLLELQNDFNEQNIRFARPLFIPRTVDGPNVQGYEPDDRLIPDRDDVMVDLNELHESNLGAYRWSQAGGNLSVAFGDVNVIPCPFGYPRKPNPFIPIAEQSDLFMPATLPAFANNILGFRKDENPWRVEHQPERRPSIPAFSPHDQIAKMTLVGSQMLY